MWGYSQMAAVCNRSRTDAAAVQVLQLCEAMGEVETKTRLVNAMAVFENFNQEMAKPFSVSKFLGNTQLENDVMCAKKILTESWALPEAIRIAMENLVGKFDQDVAEQLMAQQCAFKEITCSFDYAYVPFSLAQARAGLHAPNYDC